MKKEISDEKIIKYLEITGVAIKEVMNGGFDKTRMELALEFFDMAKRYYLDAQYFEKKGDRVNAFAAINYSHGWLDAGARIKLFKVNDSRIFSID